MNLKETFNFLTVLKYPFVGLKLKFYFGGAILNGEQNIFPNPGIYYCSLGYSIKHPDDFFRFDYPPTFAITLFNKQLRIQIKPNTKIQCEREYWEAWWNYRYKTEKESNTPTRLNQLFNTLSLSFMRFSQGKKEPTIDYYPYILKKKYIFHYLMLDKLKEIEYKIAEKKKK